MSKRPAFRQANAVERIAKALEENSKINSLSYDQLVQIKTALMTKLR